MKIKALQAAGALRLKQIEKHYGENVVLHDPLTVHHGGGAYSVYFRYGVIVFCGCSEEQAAQMLSVAETAADGVLAGRMSESLRLEEGAEQDTVSGDGVHVRNVTPEHLAVVALILARSVALDRHEQQVSAAVHDAEQLIGDLETHGTVRASTRSILRRAGGAMRVRHAVLHRVSMLDAPDVTWEDDALYVFYRRLHAEYDIAERHEVLSQKLTMLMEYVQFVLQYVENRKAFWLEVIIILLIAVEIVFFFYDLWGQALH